MLSFISNAAAVILYPPHTSSTPLLDLAVVPTPAHGEALVKGEAASKERKTVGSIGQDGRGGGGRRGRWLRVKFSPRPGAGFEKASSGIHTSCP